MSEVKVYCFDLKRAKILDDDVFYEGSASEIRGYRRDEYTELVPKSDYDKIKEKLTTFEGMTFSENQEIAKLKQAVEKF